MHILALLVLLAAVAFWAARGANLGWTVNNIRHETPDPVTGLSGVTYEKGFIPGWDFLAAAADGPISIELKDEQSAGQMRPLADDNYRYRYVIMPMRI